jgi:hypothetical protein
VHPYLFFGPAIQPMITGGTSLRKWAPAQATGGPVSGTAFKVQTAAEK